MKKKTFLKEAGVLLIAAILVLTSVVIVPIAVSQARGHDLGLNAIRLLKYGPLQTYPIEVVVENFGTYAETNVPVEVVIEKNGIPEYDQIVMINSINAGESMNVTFPDWTPSEIGEYQVTACTQLSGDENPSNDCLTVVFYATINIFGFNQVPLGNATLDVVDGKLVISNIDTSGNDGVHILLPKDVIIFRPEIELKDDTPDISFELTPKGVIDGIPDQIANKVRYDITENRTNMSISINYSYLHANYIRGQFYLGDSPNPVCSEFYRTEPRTWGLLKALAQFCKDVGHVVLKVAVSIDLVSYSSDTWCDPATGIEHTTKSWQIGSASGSASLETAGSRVDYTILTPNGSIINADRYWLYATDCTHTLESYTDILLTIKAPGPNPISLTISDEKALLNQTKLEPPQITGPATGKILINHDYTVKTIDPLGGEIYYWVNWGDRNSSGWLGPYASGAQATASHAWLKKGPYIIAAVAKNIDGFYSGWETLQVSMPRTYTYNPLVLRLLERFPHAFPILRHLLVY